MRIKVLLSFVICSFLLITPTLAQGVSGVVTDDRGSPLVGASVIVQNTTIGTTTNVDGEFNLDYNGDYPFTMVVSFIGYVTQELEIRQAVSGLQIRMPELVIQGQEVVVSASRKPEKLQEAPAAVSVLSAEEISASGGATTPIRALINTPGVELQQQTGQRIKIALRGSSGIFSTDVFPMLDYRSLITPGLEFFDSQNSPINSIDVERIEVVLGPGSALYGPDVTTGVVHFISKDPFRHPGTTVELLSGNQNTFKGAVRHAGHSDNRTFGYKFNVRYDTGHDFTLRPGNPIDDAVLNNFQESVSRGAVDPAGFVDPTQQGPLIFTTMKVQEEDYWAAVANTSLYFRPSGETELVAAGGWNAGSAIFYNDLGEGFNNSNEYWGQLRFNHKGFFAQTYYIQNDGGSDENPVYLNRTGLIVPLERSHFELQAQYNFTTPGFLNAEWTTGADYRNAKSNTENHVYGRNEDNDDYEIYGGYLQGKLPLTEKFDVFLAGRLDGYNFTDEVTFSPRAAAVYKFNPFHSVRASFNQAANPIAASDIYFDLPVQNTPIFTVWNMGGIRPQTFNDPHITWLIPGVPDTPFDAGFPLDAAYGAVNEQVIAQIEALGAQDPTLAPLVPTLVALLRSDTPGGFSSGIASVDFNGRDFQPESHETKLISTLTAYEFGYKGLFFEKFALGFDVYRFRKTAAGGFSQVSPIVFMTSLARDLGVGVQDKFQPQIEAGLLGMGFDAATAAALAGQVGGLLNDAYTEAGQLFLQGLDEAGLPFHGIIESDQVPDNGFPMLAFGYPTRNPDAISKDWGFEVHSRYYFSDALSLFGNYTWFNRPTGLPGDLNFPQNKVRAGMSFYPETGLKGSMSYQWNQAYTSNNSTFPGKIEARSLLDASVAYGMSNGLTLELSATNLFDNKFRSLPGFPEIGRRFYLRATYDF